MSTNEVQPHPVFSSRLVELADRLERAGQPGLAAELLEIAATLTPRGEGYRQRAAALRRVATPPEDPEREYKRRNLEASHAYGMARLLEGRGDLARAQEMFDLARLRAPFYYLAYAGAGYLHLRRRDLRAALEEFVQARRLNPLDRKLAVECARIALELEDYREALRHAADALHLSHGMDADDEATARRRVETLAALCRMTREELAELHRERAAALQRACEHVALSRARMFTARSLGEGRRSSGAGRPARDDLLRIALDLRRFRAFRHFTDAQLVQVAQMGRREVFRHAHVLAREGHDDRDVFVILEGKVEVCKRSPIGNQVLAHLTVGDIVGEVAFLDHKPRSSTVLGLESGLVLRLPSEELDRVALASDDVGVALLWSFWHALAGKLRATNAVMMELVTPGRKARRVSGGHKGEQVVLDPAAKLDVLREQGLSAGELRLLATYSSEERFPPEALIFSEGDQGDRLYIVVDGQVRISRRFTERGEEALTILGRGEVFGEMALIDDLPRSADARSHSNGCTVFAIDRQRLEEVLDMDPDAARQFLSLLCQFLCRRVRAINDRLIAWRVMAAHE
jgi:CRP/FNR family transcriptional regulator, cyclic AMP receptor protein